jgi:hypothetical protein
LKYIFMIVLYAYPILYFNFFSCGSKPTWNYATTLLFSSPYFAKYKKNTHLASTSAPSIIVIYLDVSCRLIVNLIISLTKLYVFILYKLTRYIIKCVFCLFLSCDTYEHALWWYNYTLFILKTITKSALKNNG